MVVPTWALSVLGTIIALLLVEAIRCIRVLASRIARLETRLEVLEDRMHKRGEQ